MKQEERSEITRKKILDAAFAEFGQNGYAAGTVNHICGHGITKGLFYHHFKGKDELYLTCLEICVNHFVRFLTPHVEDSRECLKARLIFFEQYPEEARIFFDGLLNPAPNLTDRIEEILRPLDALNRTAYGNLIAGVTLREGVTPEKAVDWLALIQNLLNGYFSSPKLRSRELSERIRLHEQVLPEILDRILFGIAEVPEKNKTNLGKS
jgi:AcrR family transcriptional regulator